MKPSAAKSGAHAVATLAGLVKLAVILAVVWYLLKGAFVVAVGLAPLVGLALLVAVFGGLGGKGGGATAWNKKSF